jgi:hypothetical protein
LIENLDMAQTPLESGRDSFHAARAVAWLECVWLLLSPGDVTGALETVAGPRRRDPLFDGSLSAWQVGRWLSAVRRKSRLGLKES